MPFQVVLHVIVQGLFKTVIARTKKKSIHRVISAYHEISLIPCNEKEMSYFRMLYKNNKNKKINLAKLWMRIQQYTATDFQD